MSTSAPVNFIIMVSKSPFDYRNAENALNFCNAAISEGHNIAQVFFYQSGVHNASVLLQPSGDEVEVHKRWCALHEEHDVRLNVCVTAASRRGVVDKISAAVAEQANSHFPFEQVGLSAYFEALAGDSISIQL